MISIKNLLNIFVYFSALVAFVSVINFISPIVSLFFIFLILLSIYLEKNRKLLNRLFINVVSVVIVLFSLIRITPENIVLPALEALVLLLGIKFIEDKKPRDYIQIFAISVFVLAGRALLSLDIIYLVYFIILFFLVSIGLVILTFYSQNKDIILSKNQALSLIFKLATIPILAIPFTIVIFIILPRTDYPLFSFLNNQKTAITGFSSKVEIGEVSSIQETNTVAFRFTTDRPVNKNVYIRGIVLDYFDGKKWIRKDKTIIKRFPSRKVLRKSVKQTVFLTPYGENYLFSINYPVFVKGINHKFYKDYTLESVKPIKKAIKYTVYSLISNKIPEKSINLNRYLQIPKNTSKKLIKFAKSLKKGKTNQEFVNFLKRYFNKNFKYSLENLPVSEKPIEDFLFKYKYGNCEYFASATALILRINGIPARLVAGYRNVYYNEIGNYYLVLQKDAHVWVEYYENGIWHTLDTTIAPASNLSVKREIPLTFKIKLFFDTINYYYITFIVNFDTTKQIKIAKNLGGTLLNIKTIFEKNITLISLILGVTFIIAIAVKQVKIPLEKRALDSFLKTLEKKGYEKSDNEGLEEFVMKIKDDNIRLIALKWVKEYEKIIFKDKKLTLSDYKLLKNIENLLK